MYKDWIYKIDIEIDYFSAFIKAWIAFNSWYRTKYNDKQDIKIIEKIKSQNNEFKNYINSLLDSLSDESIKFKENIGNLHRALTNAAIMTRERSSKVIQISFANIAMVNTKNNCDETYRMSRYILMRTNNSIESKIVNKNNVNNVEFQLLQENYNEIELENNSDFKRLSDEKKFQLKYFYGEINPYTIESVLKKSVSDRDKNIFLNIHFIDNNEKISMALVDIYYTY